MRQINILMYHSISDAGGPTSIPASIFEAQMAVLAEEGAHVADLMDLLAWRDHPDQAPANSFIITFDDGFADFYSNAWPVLNQYDFPSTVFIPPDCMGGQENWIGANEPPRPLMGWEDVRLLSDRGVQFGSHSSNHSNLTLLEERSLTGHLCNSREKIERMLQGSVPSFAAPYGAVNDSVIAEIAKHYDIAVGTEFDRARLDDNFCDLPRIEMHYFRDIGTWRRFVTGNAELYFNARKFGRSIRKLMRV